MIYLKLFLTFLEIGALSFGGGYGMISVVREAMLGNGWLTEEAFIRFIAVSESTPGPIPGGSVRYVGSGAACLYHYSGHSGPYTEPAAICGGAGLFIRCAALRSGTDPCYGPDHGA